MKIKVRNLLATSSQKTYLSNPEESGVGTIRVKNISSFSASDAVQIGRTGEEQSEVLLVGTAAVSGTALVLASSTSFAHSTDTPVFNIGYDKLIIKRSTDGTAGTATALSGGTISITPDSDYTIFDDTTGDSAYAYKVSFYNSVTTSESSDSDWLPGTGLAFYSLGKIRSRIKNKLFSYGFVKDDATVDDWINEWLEELNNAAIKVNKGYSMGTANVAFGTSGLGTITSENYRSLKKMTITYNGTDEYLATRKDESSVLPDETFDSVHPYFSWQDNSVFRIRPAESGGTASLIFNKRVSYLSNDNDMLPLQMRSYTKSFVNYAVAESYYSDNQSDRGDRFFARAERDMNKFIEEITPRDFTGPEMMDLDFAVIGGDDITDYYY